jgi:hypothetical protein
VLIIQIQPMKEDFFLFFIFYFCLCCFIIFKIRLS